MFKLKNLSFAVVLSFVGFLTAAFAQTTPPKPQAQPSYEVVLQTVVGSNSNDQKADVPQTLAGIVKKLKTNYSYSNYRLDSTILQRVGERGAIELKTASNKSNQSQNKEFTIFSEWTLNGLQLLNDVNGQKMFQFDNFRFGQRIPIIVSRNKDANGIESPVVSYEQIGLTIQRSSFPENTPTIIGSLSTVNPDELIFLVLSVKSAS